MIKRFPAVPADPGVTRQVLSESPELMVVSFQFADGAEGKLHSHPHVQSTYVQSGTFRLLRRRRRLEVGPGDSFVIPSNAGAWLPLPGTRPAHRHIHATPRRFSLKDYPHAYR